MISPIAAKRMVVKAPIDSRKLIIFARNISLLRAISLNQHLSLANTVNKAGHTHRTPAFTGVHIRSAYAAPLFAAE